MIYIIAYNTYIKGDMTYSNVISDVKFPLQIHHAYL